MSDYEFTLYRPEFREQYLDIQRDLWSPDVEVNARHLDWKYYRNPNVVPMLIVVAQYRGRTIGTRAAYGSKWVAGYPPVTIPALCVGDLVVAPEHRGRLLFFPIMDRLLAEMGGHGYHYAFGMSGSPVTHRLSLMAGFHPTGQYFTWRRDGEAPADAAPAFLDLDTEPRPEAMSEIVNSSASDGRIRQPRDETWYAWRFQNPLSEFRFLYAESGGRLDGFLVLHRSRRRPESGLSIVEWEAANPKARARLLKTAIGRLGRLRIQLWSASLSQIALQLLREADFQPIPRKTDFRPGPLVKAAPGIDAPTVYAGRNIMKIADWDLRMSFSDGY